MNKKVMSLVGVAMLYAGSAMASGGNVHWGYTGQGGPEHWGALDHAYEVCGKGKSQSPVNLVKGQDLDLPSLELAYQATPLEVINNGHTIQVNYAAGSTLTVGKQTFSLLQFHFHTPSENNIDAKSYPMEAHLVHKNAAGKLGVLGVMFEEGAANPVVEAAWQNMPAEAGGKVTVKTEINVAEMLPAEKGYYQFSGSLTTPPCSEGVHWMVLQTPITASKAQIARLHAVLGGNNNRPLQPLNGRIIKY